MILSSAPLPAFRFRAPSRHSGCVPLWREPNGRLASVSRGMLALALGCLALAGCKSPLDNVDIKDVYGPTGRHVKNNLVEQARREIKGDPAAGVDEFEAARKLYEDQKYVEARKAFKAMVKKYGKKKEPIEEDALFYLAESDFQLGHYPDAQDGYDELLKKYASSKYLEQAVRRSFAIGRYWLNVPKSASEIELVCFETEDGAERLKALPESQIPYQFPLKPNFNDKTRPLFDTPGRAIQALKSVHLHDPTGKLADDSIMLLATYHLRRKDYREADLYFSQIQRDYSKSKFVPASYVLGAHASLMSYQGARYDGHQLKEAEKLTKAALRHPDISKQRAKLEHDIKMIDDENVERQWARVEFHQKRKEKASVAIYCEDIINEHPDSKRAAQAREILIALGPKFAAGRLKTPLVKKDASPPKAESAPYDEPEEPARLHVSDADAKPISDAKK